MSKTYGANGGVTRVKVTGLDFDEIRDLIRTKPDQVTQQIANGLDQIGQDAVADMKDTILNAVTRTGAKAQAAGKRASAGRVRGSGEVTKSRPRYAGRSMYDSVNYKVAVNNKSISLRFGWITGRPGYAFFQEYGTSNGVPAMHALTDAKVKASVEIKNLLNKV